MRCCTAASDASELRWLPDRCVQRSSRHLPQPPKRKALSPQPSPECATHLQLRACAQSVAHHINDDLLVLVLLLHHQLAQFDCQALHVLGGVLPQPAEALQHVLNGLVRVVRVPVVQDGGVAVH